MGKNDLLKWIRITPRIDWYSELVKKLKEKYKKFIVCREIGKIEKKIHYHLALWDERCDDTIRKQITDQICKGKNCEVWMNRKAIRSEVKCIAYTVKENDYVAWGVEFIELHKALQISFEKPQTVTEQYMDIKNKYLKGLIGDVEMIRDVVGVERNQLNMSVLRNMISQWKCMKCEKYRKQVEDDLMKSLRIYSKDFLED